MSQPPKRGQDYDLTRRKVSAIEEPAPVAGQIESRLPFGSGTEGLCHTIPELGNMPFVPGREKNRRVVRLVSTTPGCDLSIELQDGVNKIGRQRNGNHIVLVSGEVSRFHAEVHVSDEAILVRDLGSSNGTFVNGSRVQESRVDAGDLLGFSGQFVFKLQIDLAMQSPEVMTLEPGGHEPLPRTAPPPPPAEEVPSSLEERRRRLEEAPRRITAVSSPVAPAPPRTPPRGVATGSPRPGAPRGPAPKPAPIVPGPSRPSTSPFPVSPGAGPPSTPGQPARLRSAPGAQPPRPAPTPLGPLPPLPVPAPPPDPPAAAAPSPPPTAPLSSHDSLLEPIEPVEPEEPGDLAILERERRQLAVLYQVSKRCMAAENLAELDRLLINVLERIVSFERGFITYQLPSGDWKLVMSPKGDKWDRTVVRSLLQTALRAKSPIAVKHSASDDQLGNPGPGRTDARLLLPLRTRSAPVGAIFLISSRADSFDDQSVDFLSLFSDIAALAVVNCARIEGR